MLSLSVPRCSLFGGGIRKEGAVGGQTSLFGFLWNLSSYKLYTFWSQFFIGKCRCLLSREAVCWAAGVLSSPMCLSRASSVRKPVTSSRVDKTRTFIAYNRESIPTSPTSAPFVSARRCPVGHTIRNHCWSPPQGAKIHDASPLCQSHTRGQTGNQTHLCVPRVQNQNKGPQLCLDLQAEEQREDGQMGSGRCGSVARSITWPSCWTTVRIFHCHQSSHAH